jgi:hypothetical protein
MSVSTSFWSVINQPTMVIMFDCADRVSDQLNAFQKFYLTKVKKIPRFERIMRRI